MSLTRKIAHNTIIQFGGKALGTLLGIITIGLMTRYLGAAGFGQYSTIMAFLQLFAILVDFGLSITAIRLIADPANDQALYFKNIFTFRLATSLVFLGLAPLTALFFPYPAIIKVGIAITTLSYLFTSLNQILISLFQKELKMGAVAAAEIIGRAALLILVFGAVIFNHGLLGIMIAVILSSFITLLVNYLFALKYVKIALAFDWPIWRKIFTLTWPIAATIAFNLVYFKADTVILSLFRTQAEVGIYSAPYRILEIITTFVYLFTGLIMPSLTLSWAQKNFSRFRELFQKTFDSLAIMALPMVFGAMFVAQKLMVLIAGKEFGASGDLLKILIVATAIIFINALFGSVIVILDKQRSMIKFYIINAIIALLGYLITIPLYGYFGAAVFTVVSELFILLCNYFVTARATKFLPSFSIWPKAIAASIFMSLSLYLSQNYNVIIQIALAGLVYFIFLYLFGGISKEFVLEVVRFKSSPIEAKIEVD